MRVFSGVCNSCPPRNLIFLIENPRGGQLLHNFLYVFYTDLGRIFFLFFIRNYVILVYLSWIDYFTFIFVLERMFPNAINSVFSRRLWIFLSFMSFAYVNVNCMNRSLLFVNRMTLFIVYKSFVQLLASKSKLFISQTENYNMKKLEMMRLGLSKQKISVVGTLNSHSFPLQKLKTSWRGPAIL